MIDNLFTTNDRVAAACNAMGGGHYFAIIGVIWHFIKMNVASFI